MRQLPLSHGLTVIVTIPEQVMLQEQQFLENSHNFPLLGSGDQTVDNSAGNLLIGFCSELTTEKTSMIYNPKTVHRIRTDRNQDKEHNIYLVHFLVLKAHCMNPES